MDSLLVDLDKVLDDFEAEENSAPGSEIKPSGFQEYIEQTNKQTWSSLENMNTFNQYESSMYDENISDKDVSSVRYDFPYEPEKFDLSEADFAPSPQLRDGSYNGSLEVSSQTKEVIDKPVVNTVKQINSYSGVEPHQMNGSVNIDKNVSLGSQSLYGVTQTKEKNHSLKLQLTQSESVKKPIQADISPGMGSSEMAFQINGHSEVTHGPENPVYQPQFSSIPSLSSINSSPEYDKYPVQCNTPQTPKDPTVNPLEAQLSVNSGGSLDVSSSSWHKSNIEAMQDMPKLQNLKNDLEMSCESRVKNPSEGTVTKFTQSLPATLHQTVFQNGVNSSSSLPQEIENETLTTEVNKRSQKAVLKQIDVSRNRDEISSETLLDRASEKEYIECIEHNTSKHDSENVLNEEVYGPDENVVKMQDKTDQGDSVKSAVGFGNIYEDEDDTDLNEYLADEDVNITETNSDLAKLKTGNQSGYGMSNFSTGNQTSLKYDTKEMKDGDRHQIQDQRIETDDRNMDTSEITISITENDRTNIPQNTFETSNFDKNNISSDANTVEGGNSDLEIFRLLPTSHNEMDVVLNSKPVVPEPSTNLSPVANMSLDSGVASLNDNLEENTTDQNELSSHITDTGARPKDSLNKINRPSSLMGLSTVDFNSESPFLMRSDLSPSAVPRNDTTEGGHPGNSVAEKMIVDSKASVTEESRQLMENSSSGDTKEFPDSNPEVMQTDTDSNLVELRNPDRFQPADNIVTGRPRSWSPSDSGQPPVQKQKRPTSLNLPPPPTINPNSDRDSFEDDRSPETEVGIGTDTAAEEIQDINAPDQDGVLGAEGGAEAFYDPTGHIEVESPPPYTSTLGHVAPTWIPDSEAPVCMSCGVKFTFTKRRHHCRACGKVFCSTCCSMKNRLPYLKNQEARVCVLCHSELAIAERDAGRPPHPNNPSDYCSVVPPSQTASGTASAPPPSVLVPVLKRDGYVGVDTGSNRQSAPKQVMFSDGIRPGGDLTELDGSSEVTRMPPRRSRVQKRVERVGQGQHSPRSRRLRTVAERTTKCLIPGEGLPPLCLPQNESPGHILLSNPDPSDFMPNIKDENKTPVIFAVNTNLYVSVKIVTLDCCVNRTVWCFTTRGMTSVGQEEIVIVLESLPEENTPPRDIFVHLNNVFEDASKGNVITELGHSIFNTSFLGSRDHGGFLYIRASFQCVQKLTLPNPPFLFGILLQKWETPWAKVFPLRLLLRLGAEYRYYPCPLIGVRNRKPVFFEIGHTIMNLLADFRNYQYMLPNIRGVTIHMEDKVTKINFPRNRYEDLMKVVSNSNEHVMAVAASFSAEADSHLVCIQNDDGNYQTQAINIQSKPRKVTGASFVVFNGALKTSSGLSAKSSIVEDGLMVQITPDSMLALKQAIRDMHDYPITCGLIGAPKPDETVVVQWVEDDKNINIGVKSPVDGMNMDGIESLRIHHATDYIGEKYILRWTEIFFIQNEERGSPKWDPVDLSRIGETVATACCMALTQHLEKLKEAQLGRIGLRVTLGADNVGYEAGAKGERLPDTYMNDLDNELIPVIHRASQPDTNIVLELIFEVLE